MNVYQKILKGFYGGLVDRFWKVFYGGLLIDFGNFLLEVYR